MSDGTTTWTYTYDANGMRTSRTDSTTTYKYVYNGSQLTAMTKATNGVITDTLYFTYDANGTPLTLEHNGGKYYYVTNLQGDVIALAEIMGTYYVRYDYDAWGNPTSVGGFYENLIQLNPLRYRGYVYDQDTGLYYLQSRYYNPEIGRFISADALISTGGLLGNNMFAYCLNNPVNGCDPCGTCFHNWKFYNCEECDAFWNGVGEWCVDTYNRIYSIRQQEVQLQTQITIQQNEIIADAAESVWDFYMDELERQRDAQLNNSMALIEGIEYLTSDFDNDLGLATAIASMHTVSYGIATIVLTANPVSATAGAVLLALGSLYLYVKDLVTHS